MAAVLVSTLGCGSAARLTELEAGLADLDRQVDALGTRALTREDLTAVLEAIEELIDSSVTANADLKEDLRQILAEVEVLQASDREQRQTIVASRDLLTQMKDELDDFRGRVERQEAHLAVLAELVENSRQAPPAESIEPKNVYDAAYQTYLGGDYEGAADGFQQYLATFPAGEDADRAQYWLGEAYMGLGQFRTAIDELEHVAERYPDSDKVASSLLRIGVAYIELGEREQANEALLRVRQDYPDSDEAILALQQLDNPDGQL